jgi:hypothetical protein
MNLARDYYQVKNLFPNLKHPEKYVGKVKEIVCRSSWETSYILKFLDKHSSVISWLSEENPIIYESILDYEKNKTREKKITHRYFIDFWVKIKTMDGNEKILAVEIKPFQEAEFFSKVTSGSKIEQYIPHLPKSKRMTKSSNEKIETALKNCCKWLAAKKYVQTLRDKKINCEFVIVTEKGIIWENGKFEPCYTYLL